MALTAASTLFGNIIKWGAPSQECVAYFKIYRRADDLTAEITDKIAEVAWSKNPHHVDLFSNLNNNTAYRYYVSAISYGDKSSALSAKISATVTTTINIGSTATTSTNLLGQTISLGGATSVVSIGAESIKVGTACSTITFEGNISGVPGSAIASYVEHSATSVIAGVGLSGGGTLTSSVTLNVDTAVISFMGHTHTVTNTAAGGFCPTLNDVDTNFLSGTGGWTTPPSQLTACAVLTSHLQDSAVTTIKITSGAVTLGKLSFIPLKYTGLATICVQSAAPAGPTTGDLWVDTS